jgi:hypothetical protein
MKSIRKKNYEGKISKKKSNSKNYLILHKIVIKRIRASKKTIKIKSKQKSNSKNYFKNKIITKRAGTK